jgi:hypothetical protein
LVRRHGRRRCGDPVITHLVVHYPHPQYRPDMLASMHRVDAAAADEIFAVVENDPFDLWTASPAESMFLEA